MLLGAASPGDSSPLVINNTFVNNEMGTVTAANSVAIIRNNYRLGSEQQQLLIGQTELWQVCWQRHSCGIEGAARELLRYPNPADEFLIGKTDKRRFPYGKRIIEGLLGSRIG